MSSQSGCSSALASAVAGSSADASATTSKSERRRGVCNEGTAASAPGGVVTGKPGAFYRLPARGPPPPPPESFMIRLREMEEARALAAAEMEAKAEAAREGAARLGPRLSTMSRALRRGGVRAVGAAVEPALLLDQRRTAVAAPWRIRTMS